MNYIDSIIAYESGELDDLETIELFQKLIDSGLAWQLQGHYGRTAHALIDAGYCYPINTVIRSNVIDAVATDIPAQLTTGE